MQGPSEPANPPGPARETLAMPPVARIGFGTLDEWILGPWGRRAAGVFAVSLGGGMALVLLSFVLAACGNIPEEPCYVGQEALVIALASTGVAASLLSVPFLIALIVRGLHSMRVTKHQLDHVTAREILGEATRIGPERERSWQRLKASLELMSAGEYGGERLQIRADFYLMLAVVLGMSGLVVLLIGFNSYNEAVLAAAAAVGVPAVVGGLLLYTMGVMRLWKLAEQAREAFASEIKFLEERLLPTSTQEPDEAALTATGRRGPPAQPDPSATPSRRGARIEQ